MRPEVHAFPASDEAFAADVGDALNRVFTQADVPDDRAMEAVTELLRGRYPNTEISPRTEAGGYGVRPVWYAFRDGRIRKTDPVRERLYESLRRARRSMADSEELMRRVERSVHRAGFRR